VRGAPGHQEGPPAGQVESIDEDLGVHLARDGWAGHGDPPAPGGAAAEGACSARLVGLGALGGRPGDELAQGRLLGPGRWDCSRRGGGQVARGASPALRSGRGAPVLPHRIAAHRAGPGSD